MIDELDITQLDTGNINEKKFYTNLRDIIKTARIEQNISQEQIATKLGFTRQQYTKYELGTSKFPLMHIINTCNYLGLNTGEVINSCIHGTANNINNQTPNENTVIYNNYNYYNNFFSSLLNMDFSRIKNKTSLLAIILSIVIYFILNLFSEINSLYNSLVSQIQTSSFMIAFAITIFVVFGYTIISYIFGYIAFYFFTCLLFRIYAFGSTNYVYLNDMLLKAGMQLSCLVLTIITFYVLKKLRVNINVPASKKEA